MAGGERQRSGKKNAGEKVKNEKYIDIHRWERERGGTVGSKIYAACLWHQIRDVGESYTVPLHTKQERTAKSWMRRAK